MNLKADTRVHKQTLYRATDGILIVHTIPLLIGTLKLTNAAVHCSDPKKKINCLCPCIYTKNTYPHTQSGNYGRTHH